MNKFFTSALIAASLIPCLALADEVAVRKMMEGKVGKIDRVIKSPVAGLCRSARMGKCFTPMMRENTFCMAA